MARVSSKTSLIAAQISSLSTQQDFINGVLDNGKRVAPDGTDRDAIHEYADVIQRDTPSGSDRLVHGVGVPGLNADDLHFRLQTFHIRANAGDQSASADRDEDRRQALRPLPKDLVCNRALAGNDQRIVERDG